MILSSALEIIVRFLKFQDLYSQLIFKMLLKVTDDFEELYRLNLVYRKFDLVCRSSNPLAVVGNHVYHCCDDSLSDSDSSSSEIEDQLDALNVEDNDEAPSGHDLSLKFDRVRFVLWKTDRQSH